MTRYVIHTADALIVPDANILMRVITDLQALGVTHMDVVIHQEH